MKPSDAQQPRAAWLAKLGLGRADQRAWALYDWANSAVYTTVITAVFPLYWREVIAQGAGDQADRSHAALLDYSRLTAAVLLAMAVAGPILGAISDAAHNKKRFLLAFVLLGAAATAGLFFVGPGQQLLGAILFALLNVGLVGGYVFYDGLLSQVASPKEFDALSSSGYALGYLGGGLLLALNLAWILHPAWFGLPHSAPGAAPLDSAQQTLPVRLAFLSVAVWWALFTLPLMRWVREKPLPGAVPWRQSAARQTRKWGALGLAVSGLVGSFRALLRLPQAARFLLAFLLYSEGIGTIIRMATIYGGDIGIDSKQMIAAILLVQFAGVPFALLLARIAARVGAKPVVMAGVCLYAGIAWFATHMQDSRDFYLLALGIAAVQGGTQALSRSLFASMIPAARQGEFFGVYGVLDRFAGAFGPLVFAWVLGASGSSRSAVGVLVLFFVLGALVLASVDVAAGRRQAQLE